MIKTILVSVTGDASDNAALDTAYLIARLFDAHLDCLHVTPSWTELARQIAAENVDTLPSPELQAALEREHKAISWRARRHFEELCRRRNVPLSEDPKIKGVSVSWKVASPETVETIVTEARFHDLVVLGRVADSSWPGSVIMTAGRPVVLAPEQAPENLAPTVAIAWKDSPEAARAVTAAMPLLAKADRVLVFAVDEGKGRDATMGPAERIVQNLRANGLSVEAQYILPGERSVADAIVQSAIDDHANLLVMGGYSHSRFRELIFGGVTRDILHNCRLPVFLFH
jgi:nucleotide-binding universal stress UspA family protein